MCGVSDFGGEKEEPDTADVLVWLQDKHRNPLCYLKPLDTPVKIDIARPEIGEFADVLSVACNGDNMLINTRRGLYACGDNRKGRLGIGKRDDTERLMMFKLPFEKEVKAMGIGLQFSIILTTNGEVYKCGLFHSNKRQSVFVTPTLIQFKSNDIKIDAIATGDKHIIFLDTEGLVYTMGTVGWNYDGELGLGVSVNEAFEPTLVKSLSDKKIVSIFARCSQSAFIDDLGDVYVCGYNGYNLFGIEISDKTENMQFMTLHEPKKVEGLGDSRVVEVVILHSETTLYLTCDDGFLIGSYSSDQYPREKEELFLSSYSLCASNNNVVSKKNG